MEKTYGDKLEKVLEGNKQADELAAKQTNVINWMPITREDPEIMIVNKNPIHWNIKRNIEELRNKLWSKKNQSKIKEYGNKKNQHMNAIMRSKKHKYSNAQSTIFRIQAKKLHLRAQIKDKKFAGKIQQSRNPFLQKNFNSSKCPLGCNNDEDLEHLLKCDKLPLQPINSFRKINKVIKTYTHKNHPLIIDTTKFLTITETSTCQDIDEAIKFCKNKVKKRIKQKLLAITNSFIHARWLERQNMV